VSTSHPASVSIGDPQLPTCVSSHVRGGVSRLRERLFQVAMAGAELVEDVRVGGFDVLVGQCQDAADDSPGAGVHVRGLPSWEEESRDDPAGVAVEPQPLAGDEFVGLYAAGHGQGLGSKGFGSGHGGITRSDR
jgi:hypothetical protein